MEVQTSIQTIIENWFNESEHIQKLQSFVQTTPNNIAHFVRFQREEFATSLTAITKKIVKGNDADEQERIKYHYTMGQLEGFNDTAPLVTSFIRNITKLIDDLPDSLIHYANTLSTEQLAHQLNGFFIDTMIIASEKEWEKTLVSIEDTKKRYIDELLPLSASLITKTLTPEETQHIQEKQAFFVGKINQLENVNKTIMAFWQTLYGTSFRTLLDDMRMSLYHEISQ